jgi:hypothetical protein
MPVSAGQARKNASNASKPPADAPMPTTKDAGSWFTYGTLTKRIGGLNAWISMARLD